MEITRETSKLQECTSSHIFYKWKRFISSFLFLRAHPKPSEGEELGRLWGSWGVMGPCGDCGALGCSGGWMGLWVFVGSHVAPVGTMEVIGVTESMGAEHGHMGPLGTGGNTEIPSSIWHQYPQTLRSRPLRFSCSLHHSRQLSVNLSSCHPPWIPARPLTQVPGEGRAPGRADRRPVQGREDTQGPRGVRVREGGRAGLRG